MDRLLIRAFVGKTRARRGANDVICHDVSTKRWIVTSDCFAERRCSSHRQVSRPIHKPSKDGRCEVFPLLPTTISSLRLQRDERKLALIPNAPGMGALVYAVFENRIFSQPFINHVGPCLPVENCFRAISGLGGYWGARSWISIKIGCYWQRRN